MYSNFLLTVLALIAFFFRASKCLDPPIFIDHGVTAGSSDCKDNDPKCSIWASQGECSSNAAWMMSNCKRSCQSCQGGQKAWQLRNFLAANYDNSSLVKNFSLYYVFFDSFMLDHAEINEAKEVMTIHGKLVMTWLDLRLKWDPDQWGVSWLNFFWTQIWTPNIVQRDAPLSMPGNVSWTILGANHTGQVYMWADYRLTAHCPFNYGSFPNDRQNCCFKIDDKRYFLVRFNVTDTARRTAQASLDKAHAPGWKLEEIKLVEHRHSVRILEDWRKDPYALETTNCDICITMKRRNVYYSIEITGPAISAAVITLTSYLLPSFAHQALMLMTSIAMQIFSLFVVDSKLPVSADSAPKIVQFYTISMAITVISLVCTVLLSNMARLTTRIPPPYFLTKFIDLLGRFFPCVHDEIAEVSRDVVALENASTTPATVAKPTGPWAPVAQAGKFVMFIVFLIVYVLSMIACFAA